MHFSWSFAFASFAIKFVEFILDYIFCFFDLALDLYFVLFSEFVWFVVLLIR